MTSLPQECNIAIPYCIAIQFRRPIRFKVCFTAGCGHAITCKPSHSDQSEPRFAWACQQLCACAVEREPRIQPKFTRPFSSFWGWGLGTRLGIFSNFTKSMKIWSYTVYTLIVSSPDSTPKRRKGSGTH